MICGRVIEMAYEVSPEKNVGHKEGWQVNECSGDFVARVEKRFGKGSPEDGKDADPEKDSKRVRANHEKVDQRQNLEESPSRRGREGSECENESEKNDSAARGRHFNP